MRRNGSNFRVSRALLEALARTGSPVDVSVADSVEEPRQVEIQQVGPVCDSKLFELENGRLGFMANLAIINLTSRPIEMLEIELRSALIDGSFQWLTPLTFRPRTRTRIDAEYSAYQFPGRCELEFEYDEVINHKVVERGLLRSRRRLEGWLLGIGGLMPPELMHGQPINLTLAIVASDHSEYLEQIHVWTERLEQRPQRANRRSDLFEPVPPAGTALPLFPENSLQDVSSREAVRAERTQGSAEKAPRRESRIDAPTR